MRNILGPIVLASFIIGFPSFAIAAQRTFVASHGVDSNPCTVDVPCRSIAAAIALTDSGGEVIVLDSAGYGAFTVDKSVSVIAPAGVYAGVTVFSGNGVTVDGPDIRVVLRGLNINGLGGNTGIHYLNGRALSVRHSTIANLSQNGLLQQTAGELYVADTEARGSFRGIRIEQGSAFMERLVIRNNEECALNVDPSSQAAVRAVLTRSSVSGNLIAGVILSVDSSEAAYVTVDRSSYARNGYYGFFVGSNGGPAVLTVSRSLIAHTPGFGIYAIGSGSLAIVTASTIVRNGTGLRQTNGSIVRSLQNNTIAENTNFQTSGTITNTTLR